MGRPGGPASRNPDTVRPGPTANAAMITAAVINIARQRLLRPNCINQLLLRVRLDTRSGFIRRMVRPLSVAGNPMGETHPARLPSPQPTETRAQSTLRGHSPGSTKIRTPRCPTAGLGDSGAVELPNPHKPIRPPEPHPPGISLQRLAITGQVSGRIDSRGCISAGRRSPAWTNLTPAALRSPRAPHDCELG